MSAKAHANDFQVSLCRNRSPQKRKPLCPGSTVKQSADSEGVARSIHKPGDVPRQCTSDPTDTSLKRLGNSLGMARRSADLERRSHDATDQLASPGRSHDPGWLLRKPLDSESASVDSVDSNSTIGRSQPSFMNGRNGVPQSGMNLEHAQLNGRGGPGDNEVSKGQGNEEVSMREACPLSSVSETAAQLRKSARRSLRKRKPVKGE